MRQRQALIDACCLPRATADAAESLRPSVVHVREVVKHPEDPGRRDRSIDDADLAYVIVCQDLGGREVLNEPLSYDVAN